jgi:hypothetical protein
MEPMQMAVLAMEHQRALRHEAEQERQAAWASGLERRPPGPLRLARRIHGVLRELVSSIRGGLTSPDAPNPRPR